MKIKKNKEKSRAVDVVREFYANIEEIRNLYEKQGYLKAKSLYEEMVSRHKWQMSYVSFTVYFNKEIKHKTTKEKSLIDNNSQINQNQQKEIKDEKQPSPTINSNTDEIVITDESRERFRQINENLSSGITAHLNEREQQKLKEKEDE